MISNGNEESRSLGSRTARNGFQNEDDVARKFNLWKTDRDSRQWLRIMGYKLNEIEKVEAVKLHGGYKTDVQVQVTIFFKDAIDAQNLSIKLVSNPQGYNQVDKRWVDKYIELWNIPTDIATLLKLFTGEEMPASCSLRDARRMFFDEMTRQDQTKITDFFTQNKFLVISDIIKGRGRFSADWMLVALITRDTCKWALKSINEAMNLFANGPVIITKKGSLKIGKITMQRKGGDSGRPTATMLQFKINPIELFDS